MAAPGQEAIVVPDGSAGISHYVQSFFTDLALDDRFTAVTYNVARPRNTLQKAEQINISIEAEKSASLIDLSHLLLVTEIELTKSDGGALPATANIGVINNVAHSLIRNMIMTIGQVQVNPYSNYYDYRCHIEALLSLPMSVKETQAGLQGWATDQAGAMEKNTTTEDQDSHGMDIRTARLCTRTGDSSAYKAATYYSRLMTDFTGAWQPELVNGVPLEFNFFLNKPEFFCMGQKKAGSTPPVDYGFKINTFDIYYPVCHLRESVALDLDKRLSNNDIRMHFRRRYVQTYNIPKAKQVYENIALFSNQAGLPARAILGLVDTDAFYGNIEKNPYNFRCKHGSHMEVKKLTCTINGVPIDGLPCTNEMYYYKTFWLTGFEATNGSHGIRECDFMDGSALYILDFSTSLEAAADAINPTIKLGRCRVDIEFAAQTTKDMTLVVFSESPSKLEIAKDRSIKVNYVYR